MLYASLELTCGISYLYHAGVYDLSNDPRQIKRAITIGQQRPLLSKRGEYASQKHFRLNYSFFIVQVCTACFKVYVAAGPGHYNLDKMAAVRPGEKEVLSSVAHLKLRPVGSFQPYREAMKPSKFTVKKSSIFLLSETE